MNNSQTAFKVREQLDRFLGIFSPRFSKPAVGFLGDMLYGLQAAKDIKLSCIGRCYWACAAIACEPGARHVVPLHLRLWSCDAPGFVSENDEIEQAVKTIQAGTKRRGVYVIDRGGDREELFNFFLGNELRFTIRLVGNRHLLWRHRPFLAEKLAAKCRMRYAETLRRETEDGERIYHLEYGVLDVRLPGRAQDALRLVVVRGFGEKPLMLLTTEALSDSRDTLWKVVESYCTRWRVEDAIRFIKGSYRLEDIRLLDYTRLRNMMAVLLAAVFFASAWLGESLRRRILVRNVTRVSRRLFGVPDFHYYAIADGLATLLQRFGKWRGRLRGAPPESSILQPERALFSTG